MSAQTFCVFKHDRQHFTKFWRARYWSATKCINKIAEQPWAAQTTSTNHHSVATGLLHHAQCIACFPDITIAKNRNGLHRLLQLTDCFPMCARRIVLLRGTRVQCNRNCAGILANQSCFNKCDEVIVDAHAKFACHGNAVLFARSYCRVHNGAQQLALQRHCCSTTSACHLWRRATKI